MKNQHYVTPPRGIAIKFNGVVDMNELYRQMKLWLEDKGYAKESTLEKRYVERIKPNGKQLEILWQAEKSGGDYFKYKLEIKFILMGVNEIEVQKEEGKVKLLKGNFQIYITGYVEEGSDDWDSLGFLNKIYYNLFQRKKLDSVMGDFYSKIYSFHTYIKNFLEIRT